MSIIRRVRTNNFAIIPNEVAEDKRLSFEARGILVYLLAKPDNWRINAVDIQRNGNIGKHKAYRIIGELRDVGYLEHCVIRTEKGQVCGHEYVLHDVAEVRARSLPSTALEPRISGGSIHFPKNQILDNPDSGKSVPIIRTNNNQELNTISSLRSEIDHHFSKNDGFCGEADFFENENSGLEPEPISRQIKTHGTPHGTPVGDLAKREPNPPSSRAKTTASAKAQGSQGESQGCDRAPLAREVVAQNPANLAKNEIEGGRTMFNPQNDIGYQTGEQNAPMSLEMNSRGYLDEDDGCEFHLTSPQEEKSPAKAKNKPSTKPSEKALAIVAKKAVSTAEFEQAFWPQIVRKVGKAAARKAFLKAREKASLDEIMAGLERYQQAQRRAGTQMQYWLHPATFLNGERWEDEPEPIMEKTYGNSNTKGQYNRTGNRAEQFTGALCRLGERLETEKSRQETDRGFPMRFQGRAGIDERRENKTCRNVRDNKIPPLFPPNRERNYRTVELHV